MVVAANEKECQLILSLADTEFDKDDQASPSKAILLNTHGKELFTALDCFVSAFVEAFHQCNDFLQNVKSDSIRAIKFEREFSTLRNDQNSELFMAWTQLAGDAHSSRVDCT